MIFFPLSRSVTTWVISMINMFFLILNLESPTDPGPQDLGGYSGLRTKHLPPQAPQGQGHFSNKHPGAKAPGQGHSNGFVLAFKAAVCQPANAPNAPKPSKPSKQPPKPSKPPKPSQAPQGQGHFSNKHPGAKALGQGHSNGFLLAFKAAVCQPANAPKLSKRSKTV